jgi:hypothetical protein
MLVVEDHDGVFALHAVVVVELAGCEFAEHEWFVIGANSPRLMFGDDHELGTETT